VGGGEGGEGRGGKGGGQGGGVEPAGAARPPGHGAELAAALPDETADIVGLLGRERPLPHAGGVGLADAEDVADRPRPKPRAGRGLGGDRVGGGHERVGAVIDVEEGALRAFEKDALALAALVVEQRPYRI